MEPIKFDHSKDAEDYITKGKEPIRKGCQNMQCLCTGACQEIIGWCEREVFGLGSIIESIKSKKLGI